MESYEHSSLSAVVFTDSCSGVVPGESQDVLLPLIILFPGSGLAPVLWSSPGLPFTSLISLGSATCVTEVLLSLCENSK